MSSNSYPTVYKRGYFIMDHLYVFVFGLRSVDLSDSVLLYGVFLAEENDDVFLYFVADFCSSSFSATGFC